MTSTAIRWIAAACLLAALSCGAPNATHPSARGVPATTGTPKPAVQKHVPTPGKVTRIPLDRLFTLQQSKAALIYDVRPGFSFGFGHIPGAISWPKGRFADELAAREMEIRAAIAARRPVVFYCTDSACPDSNTIASRLAARGFPVCILDGGFAAWKTAELPTE